MHFFALIFFWRDQSTRGQCLPWASGPGLYKTNKQQKTSWAVQKASFLYRLSFSPHLQVSCLGLLPVFPGWWTLRYKLKYNLPLKLVLVSLITATEKSLGEREVLQSKFRGGLWEHLGPQVGKATDAQSLKGCYGSLGERNIERVTGEGGCLVKFQRGHLCDILD